MHIVDQKKYDTFLKIFYDEAMEKAKDPSFMHDHMEKMKNVYQNFTSDYYFYKPGEYFEENYDFIAGLAVSGYIEKRMVETGGIYSDPQIDIDNVIYGDADNSLTHKNIVKFLDNNKAKNDYKNAKINNANIEQNLRETYKSTVNENSFFATHKALLQTNPYSGEKLKTIDNFSQSFYNIMIKENQQRNDSLKTTGKAITSEDPYLISIEENYFDLFTYMNKAQTVYDKNIIKNDNIDTTIVDVNTYGLDPYNNELIAQTQKQGTEYIDKRWLSSDVYHNFEAVDMSDKYKYGSMDKNTQFANAMKFAQIFGISEEEQKTEQFKKDSNLFNEIYYGGLDYMMSDVNLKRNFKNPKDPIIIDMAKDFFGENYNDIVINNQRDIGIGKNELKSFIDTNTKNTLSFVNTKDDLMQTLQNTEKYISETKYLDEYSNVLNQFEKELNTGNDKFNRIASTKYENASKANERYREQLLSNFDKLIKELEKNGTIDEYVSYKDQEKLVTSPIFKKAIYA